jgi:pimeloyl-ACP methyl ester carboxylesterase
MHLLSSGSGYPVLFIHGMPTNGRLWDGIIGKLRAKFECLAVDLPGLGKTPQIPYGPKQLSLLANQIEQIRIERGIEKWHVVGHDAGSAVAIHYAHQFQEHVDHLVLLSPAVFPELKPFHLFRYMRAPIVGEILAPLVSAIFWSVVMRIAIDSRQAESANAVRDFRASFSGLRGAWRFMTVMRYGDPAELLEAIPAMLPQLTVPTLIFHGAQDTAIPPSFAQRASALIPKSKVLVLDSGHFIPLTKPDAVATELCRFFEAPGATVAA